jgi:predicted negative regulator of RcsB-dependent stress response
MTLTELFVYVRDGGTLAVLLLIIVGGMRGWYIWKREADEYRERIDRLETALERATRAADRATGVAEQQQRSGGSDA